MTTSTESTSSPPSKFKKFMDNTALVITVALSALALIAAVGTTFGLKFFHASDELDQTKTTVNSQGETISELNATLNDQAAALASDIAKIGRLEQDKAVLQADNENLTAKNTDLSSQVASLSSQLAAVPSGAPQGSSTTAASSSSSTVRNTGSVHIGGLGADLDVPVGTDWGRGDVNDVEFNSNGALLATNSAALRLITSADSTRPATSFETCNNVSDYNTAPIGGAAGLKDNQVICVKTDKHRYAILQAPVNNVFSADFAVTTFDPPVG